MPSLYKLRTIDVWDTLIRRRCHPECIKLAVARYVYLCFRERLTDEFRDAWKLYAQRLDVEKLIAEAARAKGIDDEYILEDVVKQWLEIILPSSPDELTILVAQIVEVEFQFECDRSFPDPVISLFLEQYPAEQSIFLSDFYMKSETLFKLISYHRLSHLAPRGVSSCDIGFNKRSGKLFHYIHTHFAVTAVEQIHVGDNIHSDVAMPKQIGIKAVHFLPEEGQRQRELYESLFSSRSELFTYLSKLSLEKAKQYLVDNSQIQEGAFLAGLQAAPLFIGFSLFVAERCVQNKIEQLLFQTREGEFFLRVFSTLFPLGKLTGVSLPLASVIEVSRLATFTASLNEVSVKEFKRVWDLLQSQSMAAFFKMLDMPIDNYSDALLSYGLVACEVIERPWQDERVLGFIQDAVFKEALLKKVTQERSLLQGYLRQHGIMDKKNIAVVDIGWRGTIQDNLALILPDINIHGYYLGLQRYINPQPSNVIKEAFGPNTNNNLEWIQLLDAVSPMEMLCNSGNGSVEGYIVGGCGTISARRRVDDSENTSYTTFSESFQKGVVFAAHHWHSYLENYAVSSVELRVEAMNIWQGLSNNSSNEFVDACLASTQNDIFGFGDFLNRRDIPSLKMIAQSVFFSKDRRDLIEYLKRTQWPAAIRRREDIHFFHRQLILFLMAIAKGYKHFRLKYVYLKALLGSKLNRGQ